MPSDLERAIRASKRYEAILAQRFNAEGRGLHEPLDSVEHKLDRDAVRALRLVATVRNKLVHEDGYDDIKDTRSFAAARKRSDKALKTNTSGFPKKRGIAAAVFIVAALAVVLLW